MWKMCLKSHMRIWIVIALCLSISGCSDSAASVEKEQTEQSTNDNYYDNVEEVEAADKNQYTSEQTDASINADGNGNAVDGIVVDEETGNDTARDVLDQYDELLKKVVAGEEMICGDGEAYDYSSAMNPAYALYDINGDSIPELFVTGDKDSNSHVYTIYLLKEGVVVQGGHFNGYMPDDNLWIYGFDYLVDAYAYNADSGFAQAWRVEYPFEDEGDTQYSTDKKFKSDKTKSVTIKKKKTTSKEIKKLKRHTKYYIRIRTYKKSGSKLTYSKWSKIKSVRTK